MQKTALFSVICLFFGTGFGFLLAAVNEVTLSGHDHADPLAHGHGAAVGSVGLPIGPDDICMATNGHGHGLREIAGQGPAPTLALELHPDTGNDMNLRILTTHFRFTPERVNGPHVHGEGHAHIYVDGVKIARSYGPWFQLTNLPSGAVVHVTLNANSHEELAVDGKPVAASIFAPVR